MKDAWTIYWICVVWFTLILFPVFVCYDDYLRKRDDEEK